MRLKAAFGIAAIAIAITPQAHAQSTVVLDDFNDGTHFDGGAPGRHHQAVGAWYSVRGSRDGNKQNGTAVTLDGSQALKLSLSRYNYGGTNGVVRIFQHVVPTNGSWHVKAKVHIADGTTPYWDWNQFDLVYGTDTVQDIQVGVVVNGHYSGSQPLSIPASIYAHPDSGYLTPDNDNDKPTQNIRTSNFTANAGDDIMVIVGTDVTSGDWDQNSADKWYNAGYIVDDIILESSTLPVTLSDFSLE